MNDEPLLRIKTSLRTGGRAALAWTERKVSHAAARQPALVKAVCRYKSRRAFWIRLMAHMWAPPLAISKKVTGFCMKPVGSKSLQTKIFYLPKHNCKYIASAKLLPKLLQRCTLQNARYVQTWVNLKYYWKENLFISFLIWLQTRIEWTFKAESSRSWFFLCALSNRLSNI